MANEELFDTIFIPDGIRLEPSATGAYFVIAKDEQLCVTGKNPEMWEVAAKVSREIHRSNVPGPQWIECSWQQASLAFSRNEIVQFFALDDWHDASENSIKSIAAPAWQWRRFGL